MAQLLLYGAIFSALLIALRVLWIFPGAFISNLIRRRILHQKEPLPPARQIFIVGWTGMRGVISLAAAIALPQTLANGAPFMQRDLIIFLTFMRDSGDAGASGTCACRRWSGRSVWLGLAAAIPRKKRRGALFWKRRSVIWTKSARKMAATWMRSTMTWSSTIAPAGDSERRCGRHSHGHHRRLVESHATCCGWRRQTAVRLRNEGRINDELLRDLEQELDLARRVTCPAEPKAMKTSLTGRH